MRETFAGEKTVGGLGSSAIRLLRVGVPTRLPTSGRRSPSWIEGSRAALAELTPQVQRISSV